ncbi:MAG: hypothetical protein WA981_04650 [Glaciecola sp.]
MKFKFLKTAAVALLAVSSITQAAMISVTSEMVGNTFQQDFSITNNSDAGVNIESLTFDLRPLSAAGVCFDLVSNSCHSSTGLDFSATVGAVATGFISSAFSDEIGGITGGLDFLTIDFSDFNATETFAFKVDVDQSADPAVLGDDLIGSIMTFNMSDGNSYFSTFVAGSQPNSAVLSAASVVNASSSSAFSILMLGMGFLVARRFVKQ